MPRDVSILMLWTADGWARELWLARRSQANERKRKTGGQAKNQYNRRRSRKNRKLTIKRRNTEGNVEVLEALCRYQYFDVNPVDVHCTADVSVALSMCWRRWMHGGKLHLGKIHARDYSPQPTHPKSLTVKRNLSSYERGWTNLQRLYQLCR